jgi:hypothetical protein
MKKPELLRYLISSINYDRRRNAYLVDVLRVDDSLNFAARTGVGSTLVISKGTLEAARKMHGQDLIGAPVICKVTYDTGNILGSSAFYANTR